MKFRGIVDDVKAACSGLEPEMYVKVGDNGRDVSRVWLENQGGDGGLSLQTRTVQGCNYSAYILKPYRWRRVPSVIAHLSARKPTVACARLERRDRDALQPDGKPLGLDERDVLRKVVIEVERVRSRCARYVGGVEDVHNCVSYNGVGSGRRHRRGVQRDVNDAAY